MPDEIDRYGPLGFYHLAEDFCRAAVHSASLENSKPRLHYNLVLYHLHTHSIELTLKAFLRAKGIDVKELKNKFSHGMMGLMAAATRKGSGLLAACDALLRPDILALQLR
ncbi:hypothetical protein FXV83_40335, partial [Bradyrhizobium hipponense]